MTYKTFFLIFFSFFVLVSASYAFDCNKVSSKSFNECLNIEQSNLNRTDKDLLIANLDYTSKFFPDHNFIYDKNSKIIVTDAPFGVQKISGVYIKNLWVSILTVIPGVFYNDSLYVNKTARVLSGLGSYDIVIPSNYQSGGYPGTLNGDCKTTYSLASNSATNSVFVNNAYQGSGNNVLANVLSDSTIRTDYSTSVSIRVSHYRWYRSCYTCSRTCRYSSSETRTETLIATDKIDVKSYNNNLFANLRVIDSYNSNTKIDINYSDSVFVNITDSFIKYDRFVFDVFFTKEPYYFYMLRAKDYNQESSGNVLKDGNDFIVKNISRCEVSYFDFFNNLKNNCNLTYLNINITLITDKFKYAENETININIVPANISVNVSYGNQSRIVSGKTSFIANKEKNKIIASYEGISVEKIVFVNDTSKLFMIFNLSIFGGLNYVFYIILRRYLGGLF